MIASAFSSDDLRRFEASYTPEPNSGCWLWTGALSPGGYGWFWAKSKNRRANRASYELHHGTIPAGMFVCHRCDVPACVNPAHLFLGTARDNARDRDTKGRGSRLRGEDVHSARLTRTQVEQIRAMRPGAKIHVIAAMFGISKQHVSKISRNERWSV